MSIKVAGTAFVKIDGVQYAVRGNIKASLGDIERESVVGIDGYHGIKEKARAPYIEMDITDRPEVDLKLLEKFGPGTVTIQLINGKTGTLRDAYQMNKIELNVDEGQATIRFEGPGGEWLTA